MKYLIDTLSLQIYSHLSKAQIMYNIFHLFLYLKNIYILLHVVPCSSAMHFQSLGRSSTNWGKEEADQR